MCKAATARLVCKDQQDDVSRKRHATQVHFRCSGAVVQAQRAGIICQEAAPEVQKAVGPTDNFGALC